MKFLMALAFMFPSILWAQTIDQVKKYKLEKQAPPAAATNSSPTATTAPREHRPSPHQPTIHPTTDSAVENTQFNFLLSPQFKKLTRFISNKKVVAGLNTFSDRAKFKMMAIGQAILIVFTLILRAWVGSKTNTFMARVFSSIWITGLYVFFALMVLPNFIYGPIYFEFVRETYAFTREFIG